MSDHHRPAHPARCAPVPAGTWISCFTLPAVHGPLLLAAVSVVQDHLAPDETPELEALDGPHATGHLLTVRHNAPHAAAAKAAADRACETLAATRFPGTTALTVAEHHGGPEVLLTCSTCQQAAIFPRVLCDVDVVATWAAPWPGAAEVPVPGTERTAPGRAWIDLGCGHAFAAPWAAVPVLTPHGTTLIEVRGVPVPVREPRRPAGWAEDRT